MQQNRQDGIGDRQEVHLFCGGRREKGKGKREKGELRCRYRAAFGHALQLIVDIMLQMVQQRHGLSDDQLDQFVVDFVGRLPVSYQHALQLKDA